MLADPRRTAAGWAWALAGTGVLLALLQAFLTSRLVPVLAGDESFFKGIAYQLWAHGLHAETSGYYRLIEPRYHGYPPLFFLALAAWFKAVGFGALQNHAFVSILRVVGAVLGGGLAGRLAAKKKALVSSVGAVAIFSYARMDRPDHLAWVLCLTAVVLLLDPERTTTKTIAATLASAAALVVVPSATIVYGVLLAVVVARTGVPRSGIRLGLAAFSLFLLCQAALYLAFPLHYRGFIRSCIARVVRTPDDFSGWLMPSGAGLWVPWFALFLLFLPLWRRRSGTSWDADAGRLAALFWGTAASAAVWAATTPDSYVYLMFLFPFVVVVSLASLSRLTGVREKSVLAAVALALALSWVRPALDLARAAAMREEDRYEHAAAAIRETLGEGSIVVADGPLWTALVERYDFYDLGLGASLVASARYVVTTGHGTGRLGVSGFETTALFRPGEFRLVRDTLLAEPQRLFGIPLGRSRLGYGLRIYERVTPAFRVPAANSFRQAAPGMIGRLFGESADVGRGLQGSEDGRGDPSPAGGLENGEDPVHRRHLGRALGNDAAGSPGGTSDDRTGSGRGRHAERFAL